MLEQLIENGHYKTTVDTLSSFDKVWRDFCIYATKVQIEQHMRLYIEKIFTL